MPAGRSQGFDWVYIDTPITFEEVTTPSPVAESNTVKLYGKDNGSGVSTLCYQNDAGTEVCMPTAGPFVTGSGAAGHVAFWTSASVISGESNLFWDSTNNYLGILTATPSEPLDVRGDVRFGSTASPIDLFWNDTKKDLVLGASQQPGGALDGRGIAIVRTAGVAELDIYGLCEHGYPSWLTPPKAPWWGWK